MSALPGEIVLEHASRAFDVRADRVRTLKEAVLTGWRRRAAGAEPVQALKDVTLRVAPGQTLGMVGRNGAGKTSTLRCLAGIVPLDSGRAECGGRTVALLDLAAGFGRDFSGRENIELQGALHGLDRVQIAERTEAIIEFSELGTFIDAPVRTYSSGMFVRLGFSIAAHLDADVMLIDEVLAVGDEAFQRKCMRRIAEQIDRGTTLVLVSHDLGAIERVCERVVVLDGGEVAFDGPTADALLHYHRMLGTEAPAASLRRAGGAPLEVIELVLDEGRRRVFQAGEPLMVDLAVAARAEAADPRVVLEVRDERGQAVFRTSAPVQLEDGYATLRYEIPRLALLGGDYDIAAGAHDGERESGGFDRVERFAVARESGAEGVADLRGEWAHNPREARREA